MKVKNFIFRFSGAVCALGAAACTAFLLVCVCTGGNSDLSEVINTEENLFLVLAIMLGLTCAGLMLIPFFLIAGRQRSKLRKTGKICAALTAGLAIAVAVTAVIPVCFPETDALADCEKEPELYTPAREITEEAYPVYSSSISLSLTEKKIKVHTSAEMTEVYAAFKANTGGNAGLVSAMCEIKDSDAKLLGTVSIPLSEELNEKFRSGKAFTVSLYVPATGGHFYDFVFYWMSDDGTAGRSNYLITN